MQEIISWILHFDKHLAEIVSHYGTWTYAILFVIIFAETGVVIAPFLPGDSLLFAAGAIAARDDMELSITWLCVLLTIASILGDTVNYHLGLYIGPRVFKNPQSFLLNPAHLAKTQQFFDRYGGKTIILARFMPIVRTFAPFVAGIGKMNYFHFLAYNVVGGVVWVLGFVLLGYAFGQNEFVKKNFPIVILAIIFISILPAVYEYWRHRSLKKEDDAKEVA